MRTPRTEVPLQSDNNVSLIAQLREDETLSISIGVKGDGWNGWISSKIFRDLFRDGDDGAFQSIGPMGVVLSVERSSGERPSVRMKLTAESREDGARTSKHLSAETCREAMWRINDAWKMADSIVGMHNSLAGKRRLAKSRAPRAEAGNSGAAAGQTVTATAAV